MSHTTVLDKCDIDHTELFKWVKRVYPPGPRPDLETTGKRAPYGAARHRTRKTTLRTSVNGICTHTVTVDKAKHEIKIETADYVHNAEIESRDRHDNLVGIIAKKVIAVYKVQEILFGD